MKRSKFQPWTDNKIESTFWYAYAISGIWDGTWKARRLLDKSIRPSYALHAKAMAVVVFDRALNGETLDEAVS